MKINYHSKNKNGFTFLEKCILGACAASLTVAGYLVYDHEKQKNIQNEPYHYSEPVDSLEEKSTEEAPLQGKKKPLAGNVTLESIFGHDIKTD